MKSFKLSIWLLVVLCGACSKADNGGKVSDGAGKGGSLAKFTISGDHLYVADGFSLHVYDVFKPGSAVKTNEVQLGFEAETIFPYRDKLFIGSRDGMYIFSLQQPAAPVKLGEARHVRSCDPVVANDTVSFVTLRGGTRCGPVEDGLYIYDVKDVQAPVAKGFLSLSQPMGLGLKDSVVFVCRDHLGLSVVNVSDISQPKLMYTLTNASYKDVIPYGDLLICYTHNGLLLYNISDLSHIVREGDVAF